MWAFLSTIIGGFVSIGAVVFVEYLRRPSLELSKEDPPLDNRYDPPGSRPATEMRSLRVEVSNETLPWFARWMDRAPALQCRATITFHHLADEQDILGRAMEGRRASTPEPLPIVLAPANPQGQPVVLIPQSHGVDIYPGESELLDIAIRADNDTECYGWNNETYFSTPQWRNPRWRLDPGLAPKLAPDRAALAGTTRLVDRKGARKAYLACISRTGRDAHTRISRPPRSTAPAPLRARAVRDLA
jgi:hypothetical protein